MSKIQKISLWLLVSALVVVLDQSTKFLINHYLRPGDVVPILSFLNLIVSYNTGAAFSFLSGFQGGQIIFLAGLSIIISIVVLITLFRSSTSDWLQCLALSLVLGGAIGNLIDRIRLNYVTDFIDFHLKSWHFATFNVADSAITIGAALLIIKLLFVKK